MTAAVPAPPAPARNIDTDRLAVWGLTAAVAVPLIVFVVVPLIAILRLSFVTPEGIGLANYAREFGSPNFARIVANSFNVSRSRRSPASRSRRSSSSCSSRAS